MADALFVILLPFVILFVISGIIMSVVFVFSPKLEQRFIRFMTNTSHKIDNQHEKTVSYMTARRKKRRYKKAVRRRNKRMKKLAKQARKAS